ncbi:DUF86 domain-containing protein [Eubacterium limosum]|uniref:HepT-like ribonuclease domain-containing protein n=1 Tax=Eubacterium limosum TaxID=1736 RepID=UPI0029F4FEE5|nr:HepT-like ribonuclease domain-containing protein [Eubacterium limosum]
MAGHIHTVLKYSEDCHDIEAFQSESMRVEACVFNLMQIGELAKQSLSDSAKNELNNVPWKQLYGMRNRIVHGYDGVDMRIVWDTIRLDLPELLDELERILEKD